MPGSCPAGLGSIHQPVVERQRQRQGRAGFHGPVRDQRPGLDEPDRQDRPLGVVDDRGAVLGAERADVADRDRAARDVLGPGPAYIGFTGGTGRTTVPDPQESISTWTFSQFFRVLGTGDRECAVHRDGFVLAAASQQRFRALTADARP